MIHKNFSSGQGVLLKNVLTFYICETHCSLRYHSVNSKYLWLLDSLHHSSLSLNVVTSKKPSFTLLFIKDFLTTHSNSKTLPYFTSFWIIWIWNYYIHDIYFLPFLLKYNLQESMGVLYFIYWHLCFLNK